MTEPRSPDDEDSPLEAELKQHPELLVRLLSRARHKTGNIDDAKDVRGTTLLRAIRKEHEGDGWQRDKISLLAHLIVIMDGVLSERRRRMRRKPTAPLEDAPESHDAAPLPDHAYIAMEDKCRATAKLREALADDSQGARPIAILSAWGEGIEAHTELAQRIQCTVPEIRAAIKRLHRCVERIAQDWS